MKEAYRQITADKITRIAMSVSFGLILLHITYLTFFYFNLPPVVPLYNQMPWGEARLGSRVEVIIPIAITVMFFISNYFFLAKLYSTMPLVSRMISITTLLVSLLSFIFIIRTLQLIL